MKSLAWVEKLIAIFVVGMLVVAVGCGTSTTASSESADSANAQSAVASNSAGGNASTPVEVTAQNLTGVWLGKAVLDAEKLHRQVSQLDPAKQKLADAKAKSFLSTVMAMEFRDDGTLQSEVELIATNGKVLRDGSIGSWRVLESKPNGLMVQTQEQLADGTVATVQCFYQFSGDRNQIAIKKAVSQDLENCDAMIIFARQTLPPVNVAAGPSGTVTK